MDNFKAGDVVKLKSNGPKMTVDSVEDMSASGGYKDAVNCSWFDPQKVRQKDIFNGEGLELSQN